MSVNNDVNDNINTETPKDSYDFENPYDFEPPIYCPYCSMPYTRLMDEEYIKEDPYDDELEGDENFLYYPGYRRKDPKKRIRGRRRRRRRKINHMPIAFIMPVMLPYSGYDDWY
ncbi:hypothetical protein [Clostridium sp.]|uniref:hypothetical protein n=1 Tax=Clostridium sp. TaxID=1506 RepID=UPI002FDEF383